MRFKTLPRFPLRWPSPAKMRAYARARREEAIKAAQAGSTVGKREGNGSAPGAATSAAPQSVGARARALVREQLKDGPKPESSVMAAATAADIPERTLIAAASVLGVRTRRGQWWLPS
jgi:hypothetical protein